MNDGRSLAVEIVQAQSHVMKDGVADLLWENAVLLNAGGEVGGEELHDQDGCSHSLLEIDSQKLDNVGVAYLTE